MADGFPADIPQQEINDLFPLKRAKLGEDVFELGLALAGTVSAGAYTGGVLDYLIEVLDAWTAAKEARSDDAPTHKVVLSTIAGASGGAINGAILTRAAGWSFPHGKAAGNPFYSAWTSGVDLTALLSDAPEEGVTGFASVLNCSSLDAVAKDVIAFKGGVLGEAGSPKMRSYFADPLRLYMMVGNISGVPYTISMRGQSGLRHDLIAHADYVRFALTVDGGVPNLPVNRPDELALSSSALPNWSALRAAALATSAFPLAFRSRPVTRGLASSGYRVTVIPSETGDPVVKQLVPRWDLLAKPTDSTVSLVAVDGGTINNEPFDIVRTSLAGFSGRNKRDGAAADRAVVMVDPFSDPETLGPTTPPGLIGLILPFVMSLVFQARFKPADIALARDPDIYSRFLVAPYGPGSEDKPFAGKGAIASGGLGGFLGFVDRDFMRYDYMLGRRNAYEFLTRDFLFPDTNPLFGDQYWTARQRQTHGQTVDGVRYLPMIPLMDALRNNPPTEFTNLMWPKLSELPDGLPKAIEKRLEAVYQKIMDDNRSDSWLKQLAVSSYFKLGWLWGRGFIRDAALKVITKSLSDQKLL